MRIPKMCLIQSLFLLQVDFPGDFVPETTISTDLNIRCTKPVFPK